MKKFLPQNDIIFYFHSAQLIPKFCHVIDLCQFYFQTSEDYKRSKPYVSPCHGRVPFHGSGGRELAETTEEEKETYKIRFASLPKPAKTERLEQLIQDQAERDKVGTAKTA